MKEEGTSFAAAVNMATQVPEDSGQGASSDLPQLFNFPTPPNELVVEDEAAPDPKRIQGTPKYRLRAHFRRFMIGSIVTMINGEMIVDEHDDTVEYEEIQNACLDGKAILCWEKTNFLKDGGVVIAMKWMVKHDKADYDKLYGTNKEAEAPADITNIEDGL